PRFGPAGLDGSDFTTPQGDTLFSVQVVPPTQGDAQLSTLTHFAGLAAGALAATLLLLLAAAPPGRWRWTVALAGAWCLTRAPLSPATSLAAFFSPATFYRPLLGVFTSSAGSLTVLAALMLFAAGVLWRPGVARPWGAPGLPRALGL